MRENVLVIGLGEVGLPIYKIIEESRRYLVYGIDLNEDVMRDLNQGKIPKRVDIMHICIPCFNAEKFVNVVSKYAKKYKPYLIIVNSTVPPQTTKQLSKKCPCGIVHSPVFGTHKSESYMKFEIKRWIKLIGGIDEESLEMAREHFRKVGIKTRIVKSSAESELFKIMETTYAGWMIVFFQEFHRLARYLNVDFIELIKVLGELNDVKLHKPIWYPDVIGGHCIMQNIDLLKQRCSSELLNFILRSNAKRKREIKNGEVADEIEKVRVLFNKYWERLWSKWEEKRE